MSVIQVSKFTYTSTNLSPSSAKSMNTKFVYNGVFSVKAVTLIFISGRGSAISSAQKGKSIGKELLSCFSHAKKHDFHENPDHIYTELTFINPLSVYYKKKKRMPLSSAEIFEDPSICSVDPDQTASIGSVWSGSTLYASIMLTNKQNFSDAVILLVF